MKYKMKVWIVNPDTQDGANSELMFDLDCAFAYDENSYGNGYWLGIGGKGFFGHGYDLRYDASFNSKRKIAWLADWADNYWSGENGAYELKKIEIEKED